MGKPEKPRLKAGCFIVRMAEAADLPEVLAFFKRNRQHLKPFLSTQPACFFKRAFWQERIGKSLAEFVQDRSLRMFIFQEDGRVLGGISFSEFVRGGFQACYLGYNLDRSAQGKGIMTSCLKVAIRFMFRKMHMHRIMANYMPRNQRSANVLRRLGFQIEGIAHNYLQINGVWEDHVLTSLTNHQWKAVLN